MEEQVARFVAGEPKPQRAPPASEGGWQGTVRKNLFATPGDSVLTIVLGIFIAWLVWNILNWAVFSAVFTGSDREACLVGDGEEIGACWAFISAKFSQFMYGLYPIAERWRVDLTLVLLIALLAPFLIPAAPYKKLNGVLLVVVFPFFALVLLTGGAFNIEGGWVAFLFTVAAAFSAIAAASKVGAPETLLRIANILAVLALLFVVASTTVSSGHFFVLEFAFSTLTFIAWLLALGSIAVSVYAARLSGPRGSHGSVTGALLPPIFVIGFILLLGTDFGLRPVPTNLWGGLMLTLVVALSGIGASLPLGILLALGRRSDLPAIRLISVLFIEFWRGVPLITVLFMSAFMIPLFLPDGVNFNQLLRALIGVALFSAAYMAEVIRGGLQALPSGQYEGARALGLGYWQMMRLIIMPQAMKLVIPGIVNTFIGLFKDTSLVYIIGLADLLGTVRRGFSDPSWITPTTAATGLVFAAFVYWLFCFSMSRYSIFVERRLNRTHDR